MVRPPLRRPPLRKTIGIDMATIFDQARVCLITGAHVGGMGKRDLYVNQDSMMNEDLEFESKPFTVLVRQLYQLFGSLDDYHRKKDKKKTPSSFNQENATKLENCVEIVRLLRESLDSEDWPEVSDKVEDQYLPIGHRTLEQEDVITLSLVDHSLQSSSKPLKRKREEEDDSQAPETKRPKMNLPLLRWIWPKCASFARGRPTPVPERTCADGRQTGV